jgi:hypothetical protein
LSRTTPKAEWECFDNQDAVSKFTRIAVKFEFSAIAFEYTRIVIRGLVRSRIGPTVLWGDLSVIGKDRLAWLIARVVAEDREVLLIGQDLREPVRVIGWKRLHLGAKDLYPALTVGDFPWRIVVVHIKREEENETGQERDEKEQAPDAIDPLVSLRFRPRCLR